MLGGTRASVRNMRIELCKEIAKFQSRKLGKRLRPQIICGVLSLSVFYKAFGDASYRTGMMGARHIKFPREKSREGINMSLMDTSDKDFVGRISSLPLFAGCGSRLTDLISLLRGRVHKYVEGEMVVCECDKATSVLVVLSGCVKVMECGLEEDARHLVGCLGPGETFGATLPALDLATYPGLVEAKDPTEILFLDVAAIRAMLASGTEPRFLANIYAAASRQGYAAWRKCALLSCYEISDRYQFYLRMLTESGRPVPKRFDIPLLAATLGVNRTALYRAIEKRRP